ncbi:MAG: hypothetical protein O7G85_09395 [Planctomycetota bacterium]|nr:hypothetical protein [Planctomycetota bacterium]
MCANPTSSLVEDAGLFEQLHDDLVIRLSPKDVLEECLVHRIAVCFWRLQRAAMIDAPTSDLAVTSVAPLREEVQTWIEKINNAWQVECIIERDSALLRRRILEGKLQKGHEWFRCVRPFLSTLDITREDRIMRSGAAITAMMIMLAELARRLSGFPKSFGPEDSEKLAWLLGESAERLPYDNEKVVQTNKQKWRTATDDLIGSARAREKEQPFPEALDRLIRQKLDTLKEQREVCEEPYTTDPWKRMRTAALLPDAATLDRLIRYESHADRSLHRALETLAKLRGATIETIVATMAGRTKDGADYEIRGERTQWRPGPASS